MIHIKKLAELTGHNGAVYALENSETENCFFSGSSDKIIAKWNLDALSAEKFAAQLPGIIYSLCFIKEKNVLLAGTSEGKIHVIDLAEKKEIKILQNHNQPVFDIKASPRPSPKEREDILLSSGGDGVLSIISSEDFNTILRKLPEGTTEFICHVALQSNSGNKKFLKPRQNVLRLLTNPSVKKNLLQNGIKLTNRSGLIFN